LKKGIIYIACLLIAVGLSLVALNKIIPKPDKSSSYYAALEDKEALLKSLPAGKIILVGGSNVAFGFDSEKISKELNRPVCNTGLYGGSPLELYLNLALANCKKNDIIILIPEYQYWFETNFSKPEFFNLAYSYPQALDYYDRENRLKLKAEFLLYQLDYRLWYYIRGEYKVKEDKFYRRSNFNKYGDFVGHLDSIIDLKEYTVDFSSLKKDPSATTIKLISSFMENCKKKGATCYLSFPAADIYFISPYKVRLEVLYTTCNKDFPGSILENPVTLIWPQSYFFDTVYHLSKEGREKRTQLLIEAIKKMH